jgi:Holliday junction resolvase RusA-like endonuclease
MSWKFSPVAGFAVPGIPVAQPRPRLAKGGHAYTPNNGIQAWKEAIVMEAKPFIEEGVFATGPFRVQIVFQLPRPAKLVKDRPIQFLPVMVKPDLDNLVKAALDAITASRLWKDDAEVFALECSKLYVPVGELTGMIITIERVVEEATR